MNRLPILMILVPIAAMVCGVAAYTAWENHHQQRAVAKLPVIISLLDQIQAFPGSKRVRNEHGEKASAHEWAAAVVWRYFVSDAPCSDVQTHFEGQAEKIGFGIHSNDSYDNKAAYTFQNGEYEFRFILEPRPQIGCDIAISTNWYGFNR